MMRGVVCPNEATYRCKAVQKGIRSPGLGTDQPLSTGGGAIQRGLISGAAQALVAQSFPKPIGFAYCPYGVDWFRERGKFFDLPKMGILYFFLILGMESRITWEL
ncbi:protein of unknown function [Cyanobium sp. NIES-981]|nr:protein of unknown function [Cyanobium sp. NIES-981]